MTGTLALGSSTQSTTPGMGILVHDLRNYTPSQDMFGDQQVNWYFYNVPNYGWRSIMHTKGWTGSYAAWEIAGPANNSLDTNFLLRSYYSTSASNWLAILHSDNYTSYTVTKTGSGASGTWNININGTAAGIHTSTPTLAAGVEYGTISVKENANGSLGDSYLALRTALDFQWYNSNWQIGNLRSGSTPSAGFGFACKQEGEDSFTLKAYITPNSEFILQDSTLQASLKPNNVSNHGNLCLVGSQRGVYYGIHLGDTTNYMTVMSGDEHQGLYNPVNSKWILYYNRTNNKIGLGTSNLSSSSITVVGSVDVSGLSSFHDLLTIYKSEKYYQIGCQNSSWAHHSTDASNGHWFNKDIAVQGNIYCGNSYNTKVLTVAGDRMTGTLTRDATSTSWIDVSHGHGAIIYLDKPAVNGGATVCWGVKTNTGAWGCGNLSGNDNLYFVWGSDTNYSAGNNSATSSIYMHPNGVLYGAAWNDYAEFRTTVYAKAGEVVVENGDGTMHRSCKRLEPAASIVSDTYGFAIGETEKCGTPIAVAGRVLAYPYEDRYSYKAGDAVCSAPDGKVSKMTREEMVIYPNCIIGYISEIPEYEVWGQTDVPVNGRIWIKVV